MTLLHKYEIFFHLILTQSKFHASSFHLSEMKISNVEHSQKLGIIRSASKDKAVLLAEVWSPFSNSIFFFEK